MPTVLRAAWLNIAFWVLFPIVTAGFILVGLGCACVYALCVRDRRKTLRLVRRSISHYGKAILRCGWPTVRVRYVDHATGETPPFVYVANHRSTSDAYLMACLPCEAVQVVNIWPFRIPVLGVVARIAGYLSVREMPIEDFLHRGTELLSQGVSVIAFPEGTRSGSRTMGPFHGSAFRLAIHAGARVAPLAISGNENIPRRASLWLQPGQITVQKLPALDVAQCQTLGAFKLKIRVQEMIQQYLDRVEGT
jgi:1-acyl-sn-glycerol-3-phosphate acyltransferase